MSRAGCSTPGSRSAAARPSSSPPTCARSPPKSSSSRRTWASSRWIEYHTRIDDRVAVAACDHRVQVDFGNLGMQARYLRHTQQQFVERLLVRGLGAARAVEHRLVAELR